MCKKLNSWLFLLLFGLEILFKISPSHESCAVLNIISALVVFFY